MKSLRTLLLAVLALSSLGAATVEDPTRSTKNADPKIAASKAGQPVSLFYSSGDAIVAYRWLPMDSAATCKAGFEVLRQHYNCDRILWREANTEWIMKWNEVRRDSPWLGDLTSDSIRINRDFKTTEHAAQEARANGIDFWGIFHLFDYSGKAECGSGGNRSQGAFYGSSPFLNQHPEYAMWDRAHITFMTAGIEYGAPEVRAEYVRRVDEMFQGAWGVYAGIFIYSFVENMEAHFTDEFIYSDFAVQDFKRRFGLDVRTQPFDLEQYYAMRGGYVTQYLRELRPVFQKHRKKLAMALNAENMESPQAWLAGRGVWPKDVSAPYTLQQGRVKMDWRTWVKEGLVDELHVWAGVGPDQKCADVRAILEATQGTEIKVSVFYQTEFAAKDQDLSAQGVRRVISVEPGNEEGDNAKHTAADIDSHDDAVVLRVLAQARAKDLAVPSDKLTALLLKHANPLVRRQAASTIGRLKLAECVGALEDAAINEPEGSVKAMAFDALGKVSGPQSVAAMARGFAKVNTFPVRMALRDTLAVLGPERYADVAKSYDTQDDYFRRVLLESFTRRNGTPESLAVLQRALHDPNDKVRWWAANAYQYQGFKPEHAEALLAALDDASGAVQCRAAVSLTGMVRRMSDDLKQRCFDKLLARYREFDAGCRRSDAEWGWRPIGETLRDGFDTRGKEALLAILNGGKSDLARLTWRVFFQPNDEHWHPIARDDMEQKYRFHPGNADHGKCTLADLEFRSLVIAAQKKEEVAKPRDIHVGADVKTIREAMKLAQPGDTIHLQPITYYESADFSGKHGQPGKPITLDGHGAVLDGSDPVKSADWESLGHDLYRKVKLMPKMDDAIKCRWFFLWNGKINRMGLCSKGPSQPLKKSAELLPDEWTYVQDEDAFYIRLPAGQNLDAANIRYPARSSAVVQGGSGSWLTVRNVTGTHVYNDGFNVHGEQRHLMYENIAAIECGDDGFSAHEDAECSIDGFTSIGNATGLCDTVSSVTHYRNVFIKDCHGYDIYFISDSAHSMENVVVESTAARVLQIAQHRESAQSKVTNVTLKNVSIRRVASTPGDARVGSGCNLVLDHCTIRGVNFIVTPRGAMNVQQSLFTGAPKPDVLLYANTIWQGAGNVYDLASLRVGQTSFTAKTFADFQKLTAGEVGSKWESFTAVPAGVGADEAALQHLRTMRKE